MMPEKDPRWQRYAALALLGAFVVALVVFRSRLADDFWPLDSSRVGPNLLASAVQTVIVLVVAALIWPPTRRRIRRFVDRKLSGVHERVEALHDRHDEHAKHLDALAGRVEELHAKLDGPKRAKRDSR